jgi:hypothetical protein
MKAKKIINTFGCSEEVAHEVVGIVNKLEKEIHIMMADPGQINSDKNYGIVCLVEEKFESMRGLLGLSSVESYSRDGCYNESSFVFLNVEDGFKATLIYSYDRDELYIASENEELDRLVEEDDAA